MGRTIDQDVHAAFVEFRAKEDDKCLSVQCIYCQQIRAKNTSRQKQHLLECPGLQNQPHGPRPQSSSDSLNAPSGYAPASSVGPPNGTMSNGPMATGPMSNGPMSNGPMSNGPMSNGSMSNGSAPFSTPTQNLVNRPPLPPQSAPGPSTTPLQRSTPQPKKTPQPQKTPNSALPPPPLDDVHAAFVEFRAKEDDKCLSVQCIYCNQIRAKNTSRQRQHLQECSMYQNVMKESIPANNLLHRFEEGDVARSLQLPQPNLELDFRMSVKLNPKIPVGPTLFGVRNWISFTGGQWAGRWGKGIVIPGGQDSQLVVKDLATHVEATYLLQTSDEPPAYITVKSHGWRTGPRDVLEKLADPAVADSVPANQYKFRLEIELETGDDRYTFLNTCMWVGSGCRRAGEVVYDAYRIT